MELLRYTFDGIEANIFQQKFFILSVPNVEINTAFPTISVIELQVQVFYLKRSFNKQGKNFYAVLFPEFC